MADHNTLKGVLLQVASGVAFCVMSALIKTASGIDSFKTSFFRFVIGLTLLGTAALFGKIDLKFVHGPFLFLRGLFGGVAVYLFFLSIAELGVAKGTVISYSYPIFAALLGAMFLKERIGVVRGLALLAAFGGILLLMKGKGGGLASFVSFGVYDGLALLGAVLSGVAVFFVKKLHQTDTTYAIFFAQCVIGVWLVVVPANVVPCQIGISGGVLLLGIGIAATIGQLLMTEGYRYQSVTVGSLLGMLVPVLNCLVGSVFFREPFPPSAMVGSVIVIVACGIVSIEGGNRQR